MKNEDWNLDQLFSEYDLEAFEEVKGSEAIEIEDLDGLSDMEKIRQIGDSIVTRLLAVMDGSGNMNSAPLIALRIDTASIHSNEDYTPEFMETLQQYIQEQIDEWCRPTILQ